MSEHATGNFIRNAWYVAAMSSELKQSLLARRVINEPLVMYRTESGAPVVLEDFCPHRLLPLSAGRLIGDIVQCGYHGLEFDAQGRCTRIPGEELNGRDVRVRRYPVVEKHNWIYIWMGDASRADPSLIPEFFDPVGDPDWFHESGLFPAKCNYLLVVDNILDLSHLAYVHSGSVGNTSIADKATVETTTNGDRVRVCRTTLDVPAAATYAYYGKFNGNIHRWQVTEFAAPAYFLVNNGSKRAIDPVPTEEDKRGAGVWGFQAYHAVTPETDTTSHDFWTIGTRKRLVPPEDRPKFRSTMEGILNEDRLIYDAQQIAVEIKDGEHGRNGRVLSRIKLKGDKALTAARRVLQAKLLEEYTPSKQSAVRAV
jgi:phenylpropionate dioxygenase-like ring-hydroxylating dioxygenase large terminal subunit